MAPINDNFSDAIRLFGQSFNISGSNIDATEETGEPEYDSSSPLNSVWYSWRAPADGLVTIYTHNNDYDTTLGVYTGSQVDSLSWVGYNDDFINLDSAVTFEAHAGTRYWIVVDGYSSSTGSFNLSLDYNGTPGNDLFNGNARSNIFYGGDGNDTLNGYGGDDYLFGDAGRDLIRGGSREDRLDGGGGNDTIYGGGDQDEINGGSGRDILYGDGSSDYIYGGDGDDILYGGAGDDSLDGGRGNDVLYGDSGRNWFSDYQGDNVIYGGNSLDNIYTGDGNDRIYNNGGSDYIYSGAGFDQLWLEGDARVELSTGQGYDLIHNFSLGQTSFALGYPLNFDDLTFANSRQGARILYQNDLLAVVSDTRANALADNPDIFV